MSDLIRKAALAKQHTTRMSGLSTEEKNEALAKMADRLLAETERIIAANEEDVQKAREKGESSAIIDRLTLTESRLQQMAEGIRQVIELPDPVGDILETFTRPNGLKINKVRVPLGVIGIIYEARPNVTTDAASLCLKTGNAVILRGSSSALNSNRALVDVIRQALEDSPIPADAVQLIEDTSRETASQMLKLNDYLDVLIPRGGAGLIQSVVQNATVPVLETGVGNCHVYIDESADPQMAIDIVINAKTDRPAVCNAAESLLIHEKWAEQHLTELIERLQEAGVSLIGCERTRERVPSLSPADDQDWSTEYLDLILAVKTVANTEEAIAHINRYGSKHSEAIVTEDSGQAARFQQDVDAAAVYHNASTRFTDGFEFGFGAEIGISTQKLHARGPMGLEALTSYKYLIYGTGQIR